jgi:hypothetical protein
MGISTNPNTQSIDPVGDKLFYLDKFDTPWLGDFIGDFPDSRYKTQLEYQQKEKDRTAKIVWITPSEYEDALFQGFTRHKTIPSYYKIRDRISVVPTLNNLVEYMKNHKVEMPWLAYSIGYDNGKPYYYFDQEGHHRTVASEILGAKQIPVFIIYPYSKKSFDIVSDNIPNSLKRKLGK